MRQAEWNCDDKETPARLVKHLQTHEVKGPNTTRQEALCAVQRAIRAARRLLKNIVVEKAIENAGGRAT